MAKKSPETPAYVPEPAVQAILEEWKRARDAQEAAGEAEQAAFDRLNALLDERLGPDVAAQFITELDGIEGAAKAGRAYPARGAGTDYAAAGERIREELGASTFRKYYTSEQVTVHHPNTEALEAARESNPEIAAILDGCSTDGVPTLTRIAPAKAGKDLAKSAVEMPAPVAAASTKRPTRLPSSAAKSDAAAAAVSA